MLIAFAIALPRRALTTFLRIVSTARTAINTVGTGLKPVPTEAGAAQAAPASAVRIFRIGGIIAAAAAVVVMGTLVVWVLADPSAFSHLIQAHNTHQFAGAAPMGAALAIGVISRQAKLALDRIKEHVSILKAKLAGTNNEAEVLLDTVGNNVGKTAQLLDDTKTLLDLASGVSAEAFGRQDLRTVVADAVAELQPKAKDKQIVLVSNAAEGAAREVRALSLVNHVIINVIDNALKYSPDNKIGAYRRKAKIQEYIGRELL